MSPIEEHFDALARLLELERAAEREENARELERLPAATREALGKSVSRLLLEEESFGAGGYPLLVFSRAEDGAELGPFHALSQGDAVRLCAADGRTVDGVLERLEERRAWVALEGRPPEGLPEGRWRLDLLGSDATYRRMRRALEDARGARASRSAELRDVVLGLSPPGWGTPEAPVFFDGSLNRWQREAVGAAMAAKDVSVIHGPPGTGKTTVLVEIIRQAAARGERVLASAPSNIAVDNMLEKLLPPQGPEGLRVVRLGHPARTLESLRRANLRVQASEDELYPQVGELEAEATRLARKLARRGRGALEGPERHAAYGELKRLGKEARNLETAISRRIVASAQVVLATHAGLSASLVRGRFDWVVLDEASQALEPLSWITLLRGDKAVLAGDPMQLPPTIHSKEAADQGLAVTLLERLLPALPEAVATLLRVQYRMHEAIMAFPSERFYGGKLIADDSVRARLLCQLPGVARAPLTESPLAFIDTAGTGYEEAFDELLQSRENEGEAALAAKIARELLAAGLRPEQLAVLTPYTAQARRLKGLLRESGLEVGTIDGFQGREKEATVVSLVRSNEKGEVGFLGDTRRMNVAITRARRLLVVLGDSATLSRHPFYRAFLERMERAGAHRSAWEWA